MDGVPYFVVSYLFYHYNIWKGARGKESDILCILLSFALSLYRKL